MTGRNKEVIVHFGGKLENMQAISSAVILTAITPKGWPRKVL